jgi:hypothetical protein
MEDELDRSPFSIGPDDLLLTQEVHELDFSVALLSAIVPFLTAIIAVLLWKLSKKSAELLREAVGASAAASSHAQGTMTIEIKGADGMPDMRWDHHWFVLCDPTAVPFSEQLLSARNYVAFATCHL